MLALATATDRPGDVRLQLPTLFDADSIAEWRAAFEALAASSARRVLLDLSTVRVLDSAAVGAISYLFKRLLATGRKLVVTGAAGQPLALLSDLGLAQVLGLPAAPSRPAAAPRFRFGLAAAFGGR